MQPLSELNDIYQRFSIRNARESFSEILRNAALLKERQIITKNNKDCAAVVAIEDLQRLEAYDRMLEELLTNEVGDDNSQNFGKDVDLLDLAAKHFQSNDFSESSSEADAIKDLLQQQSDKLDQLEMMISQNEQIEPEIQPTYVSVYQPRSRFPATIGRRGARPYSRARGLDKFAVKKDTSIEQAIATQLTANRLKE